MLEQCFALIRVALDQTDVDGMVIQSRLQRQQRGSPNRSFKRVRRGKQGSETVSARSLRTFSIESRSSKSQMIEFSQGPKTRGREPRTMQSAEFFMKIDLPYLKSMKAAQRKFAMLTSYD